MNAQRAPQESENRFPQTVRTALTEGTLFFQSQQVGLDYVLAYNPDRMLSPVYTALGKKPKAPTYGGWESRQIQGHMLGHYLSALAGFYYQTGSLAAKEKLDYTVQCLQELQSDSAFGGYIGGIPPTPFTIVFLANGDFKVERFSLADWWVPWYSVHKIYAGLIDAYLYGGNADALSVVTKMADWAIAGTNRMTDADLQKMFTCEHGGMCKVFADLYGITGDKKYLSEAERWIHHEIIDPAMQQQDKLQGYHANTQIPKFIGIARLYELTGKSEYRMAAEFFFKTVTERRSYAIGGNSKGEHFGREYDEILARDTCETCNTYNMLELAEHIFAWNVVSTASAAPADSAAAESAAVPADSVADRARAVADFYETALYNHILASQDPESGAKTYFVAMQPGFHKVYCTHDNAMWCCTGTGLENPERYNRFVAYEAGDTLYLNLFIDSTVTTSDGWKLRIESTFPYGVQTKITVLAAGTGAKTLKVRAPLWCAPLTEKAGADGYLDCGTLSPDTVVTVQHPLTLSVRRTRDGSGAFSVLYGPIVLAADVGAKNMPADIVDDQLIYMSSGTNESVEPIIADLKAPESWISLTDAATLTFATSKKATKKGVSYTLRPFFSLHHTRYATYFASSVAKKDKRTAALEKVTVDAIEVGRQQSEIEHQFKTVGTAIDYLESVDRNGRVFEAENAFVSYSAQFDATAKKGKIVLTVYGKDTGTLSVRCGDVTLSPITLTGDGGDALVDISIDVPKALFARAKKGEKTATEVITVTASRGTRVLEVRTTTK